VCLYGETGVLGRSLFQKVTYIIVIQVCVGAVIEATTSKWCMGIPGEQNDEHTRRALHETLLSHTPFPAAVLTNTVGVQMAYTLHTPHTE
jgi:hypothetical protein